MVRIPKLRLVLQKLGYQVVVTENVRRMEASGKEDSSGHFIADAGYDAWNCSRGAIRGHNSRSTRTSFC